MGVLHWTRLMPLAVNRNIINNCNFVVVADTETADRYEVFLHAIENIHGSQNILALVDLLDVLHISYVDTLMHPRLMWRCWVHQIPTPRFGNLGDKPSILNNISLLSRVGDLAMDVVDAFRTIDGYPHRNPPEPYQGPRPSRYERDPVI